MNLTHNYLKKLASYISSTIARFRKAILVTMGLCMAIACALIIIQGFRSPSSDYLKQPKLTVPEDIFMREPKGESLIPLGEMKGVINGRRESFYLAIDNKGDLFINRKFEVDSRSYMRSSDWQQITREQFNYYEKHLELLPASDEVVCN